jgi:hypothetical protein
MDGRALPLEQRHAAAAAGDEHRGRSRAAEQLAAGFLEHACVLANPDPEQMLDLRLVRGTGRHAAESQERVP